MQVNNLWELVHPRLTTQHRNGLSLEEIAIFCEVIPSTVSGWLAAKRPPQGERLIKLWHLLAAKGSDSPELQRMPPFNRRLSELFAFGQISFDEVQQMAGVRNPQNALRILRGQPPMHPALTLVELNELYGDPPWSTESTSTSTTPKTQTPSPVRRVEAPPVIATSFSPSVTDTKLTLATLLGAALPLLRHFNSDNCSPEERSQLRRLMGDDGMFEASNHLNALCSERARNQERQSR